MHAGTAQTAQNWRPLPIAPALMGLITKASGAVAKLSVARSSSAELRALALCSFVPAKAESAEAGSAAAACEQTPLAAEQGLKRRRHSDEILAPSLKLRTAGMLLFHYMPLCAPLPVQAGGCASSLAEATARGYRLNPDCACTHPWH